MMVLHVDNDKDDDNSYKVLKLLKREGGGGRERGERERCLKLVKVLTFIIMV